jgi:uncharacterized protein (TIGR02246 family)
MSTSTQTPKDTARAWGETFAARDLDAMMELFAPEAIWVSGDGDVVEGHDGLRGVFSDFMAIEGAEFKQDDPSVFEAGDTALLCADWTVAGNGPDGPVSFAGRTADVLRRQPDGRWLYVIDSPFGGGSAS